MSESKRILLAVSGGIDSAVAAALLKTQGFDVTGVFFQLWDEKETANLKCIGGSCCSVRQASDAEKVCRDLEIPFYVVNIQEAFQSEVLDYIVHEYLQGRKPSPCTACNSRLKIKALLRKADELKCPLVATGHYAKIVRSADGTETNLYRATDKPNDQSYYLFGVRQDELARVYMPVGDLLKSNIRKMAETFRLPAVDRESSQRMCFSGQDGGYIDLLIARSPERYRHAGPIVTSDGHILGRHTGIFRFSIGQREGLTLDSKPEHQNYSVVGFDMKLNAVIVGPDDELTKKGLVVTDCNWIGVQDFSKGLRAKAKIAPDAPEAPCIVTLLNNNSVLVDFEAPQRNITPGQAIVFYQEDLVIGGGWIEALTEPAVTKLRSKGMTLAL